MNPEEISCAQCIDANPNVETWVRNIERGPEYSFWIPTHKDKFYPNFVVKLKDGTFAVIEYKGEIYKTTDDSKEKICSETSGLIKAVIFANFSWL